MNQDIGLVHPEALNAEILPWTEHGVFFPTLPRNYP